MRKLREIERLRGFSILITVLYHQDLTLQNQSFLSKVWGGPDLFFVISGFVISLSLLRLFPDLQGYHSFVDRWNATRAALQVFYRRRIGRILPMAIIWILVNFVLSWCYFGKPLETLKEIFAIVTLQYNYAIPHGLTQSLVEYWTLNVEEHFYLMLPLFFILVSNPKKRFGWILVGILMVITVLRPLVQDLSVSKDLYWTYLRFTTHRRLDALLAGVAIQFLTSFGWGRSWVQIPRYCKIAITTFCLIGIFAEPILLPAGFTLNHGSVALWMLSGILVFYATFDQNLVLPIPGIKNLLEYLGSRSYGVYLIHRPAGYLIQIFLLPIFASRFPQSQWPYWVGTWILTLVLAELSYHWIELPGIRWSRKSSTEENEVAKT